MERQCVKWFVNFQQGKTIKPSRYAKATNYPIRALVGFSQDDKKWIESEIQKFLLI